MNKSGKMERGWSRGQAAASVFAEGQAGRLWPRRCQPGTEEGGGARNEKLCWPNGQQPQPRGLQTRQESKGSASGKIEQFVRRLLRSGTERPQRNSCLLSGDLGAKPVSHPPHPLFKAWVVDTMR